MTRSQRAPIMRRRAIPSTAKPAAYRRSRARGFDLAQCRAAVGQHHRRKLWFCGVNSMCISARFASAALALLTTVFVIPGAGAADLNGAWAQDHTVCSNIFVKSGNKILFTPNAELYGSGVLIEGKTATGTFQKCRIKSSRVDGDTLHILAACSTGVMVSDSKVTAKVLDENNITLTLDGPDPIEHALVRCSM